MWHLRFSRCALLAALALWLCGCSSFEKNWRTAARQPVREGSVAGRWEGRWLSDANGHHGRLRAIITERTPREADVQFHADYKLIAGKWLTVSFGYGLRLETEPVTNGIVRFRGSEDLGVFAGGIYRYEGWATATNFFSTYSSKYDRGVFEMNRVRE
jgi:hypothetical protein